jgi:hypothetical protein
VKILEKINLETLYNLSYLHVLLLSLLLYMHILYYMHCCVTGFLSLSALNVNI